ncbi:MAG: hypothetical protein VYB89_14145 [Pseudomonadota bacterium]|nr:hypothetical protein [Pseudomonadota bacterium]
MTAWRGGLPAVLADLARRQTRWTYRELAGHLAVPGPCTIRQVAEALDDSLRADHAAGRPLAAAETIAARRGGGPAPGFFQTCRELGRYFGPDDGPQAAFFHDLELRRVYAAAAEQAAGAPDPINGNGCAS